MVCTLSLWAMGRAVFFAAVFGSVLLLAVIWLAVLKIIHIRHDKALEAEMEREIAPPEVAELKAEVTVLDTAPEIPLIFMPVPSVFYGVVDFVREDRDGVNVRSCVRAEDADAMMSDEQAQSLCAEVFREERTGMSVRSTISLEMLSERFSPYSYISLKILKQQQMVAQETTDLFIEGKGVVRKPLLIEAHEFSLTALKMLPLTGGRAVVVKQK